MSEDENFQLIPVTWIKQYHFCPRIVYYLGVIGYSERFTESMLEGKEFHFSEERKTKRRKTVGGERKELVKTQWNKLYITSTKLSLYGVVDGVAETNDGLVVVENKWMKAPKRPYPGHVYQTVAYAMLVEEAFGKFVRKVVVRYVRDEKSFEIPLTEDLRRHVLWTISKIKSIIESEKTPRIRESKKCLNCGFKKICKGL
ncbi:CRISPR-associated protein Cas4, partial [Candidatus Bathyarchaeota archaeon]|nr:CRISPR-associated protein Cas4 [Candidatus Bathyarchaeota archaeon]